MMLYVRNIARLSYWFDVQALAFSETVFWIFVAWLGILIVTFIVLRVFVHKKHANPLLSRFLARVSRGVLIYGVASAAFLFFRSQEALVIGMRSIYAATTLIFVAWLIRGTITFNHHYEDDRKAHEERLRRESYFPKGNK